MTRASAAYELRLEMQHRRLEHYNLEDTALKLLDLVGEEAYQRIVDALPDGLLDYQLEQELQKTIDLIVAQQAVV